MKKNIYLTSLRLKNKNIKNCYFAGVWGLNDTEIFDKKKNKKILNSYQLNPSDLSQTYFFLENFYYKTIRKISINLNRIHKTNLNYKYWAILLSPWLQNYISVLYDRWKILSDLEKKKTNFIRLMCEESITPINNSNDFFALSQSNYFNQHIFEDILDFKKKENRKNFYNIKNKKKSLFIYYLIKICKILFSTDKFKVKNFYLDVNFNKKKNIFLDILRKVYIKFVTKINNLAFKTYKYDFGLRTKITASISKNKKRNFENYFYSRLFLDVPGEIIEGYNIHKNTRINLIKSHYTYSMYSHFDNYSFKLYLAERKIKKDKIICLEHGGSFPHYRMNFNFEENFFDKKYTWYKKYFKNHKQFQNFNLFQKYLKEFDPGDKIIIFGSVTPRYLHKIIFSRTPSNILSKTKMIRSLFESMNNEQKKNVMFKPHPSNNSNLYINTLPEFEKIFGQEKLLFESVISTINKAKILICTTPETTFTECMLSNKPTILVYDSKIYKRHNICKKLINEMKKNKIIFFNTQEASKHLNRIYQDPYKWYNSAKIKNLRKKFLNEAVGYY